MPLPSNATSLNTLLAAADSVESRVLAWLHSLPDSPADLSIADLNSAAQALWRLTAVRKTLALIGGYAPPTRPRGVHVIPPDAHPHYYPYKSKEEHDAHLAWCAEMSRSLSPGGIDPSVEIDRPWGDEDDDDAFGANLETLGPIRRSAFQADSDASIVAEARTVESHASPAPADVPAPSSSPTPERPQSSPPAPPQFPPPRALSIPSCPSIPGKLPSTPPAADSPRPLCGTGVSPVFPPAPPAADSPRPLCGTGVSPVFPPAPTPSILADRQTPEGPAADTTRNPRSPGVSPVFPPTPEGAHNAGRLSRADETPPPSPAPPAAPKTRRADTTNTEPPPAPPIPFPKAPLQFGILPRPTRPP